MNILLLIDKPEELVVRLGDWDLRNDFDNEFKPDHGEEYPHIEVRFQVLTVFFSAKPVRHSILPQPSYPHLSPTSQ